MGAADYITQLVILDGGERRAGRRCQARDAAAVTTRGENPPRPGEINTQVWRRCGG